MQDTVIIRIHDAVVQSHALKKLVGNTNLASFVDLLTAADLEANPRAAKKSAVTEDIEDSLEQEPEIFHFLTKGVLIGARRVEPLERGRYRVTFEDAQLEGILDGGHNSFALGRFIIRRTFENHKELLRGVKRWDDLKEVWKDNLEAIEAGKKDLPDIRIPVEIVYPGEGEDAEEHFQEKILRINAARNNNAQLTEETKANKKGLYEEIKRNVDPAIADDIVWKANEEGRIKARDLIALALVPMTKLPDDLPTKQVAGAPSMIFSQKGQCVSLFNDLLENKDVVEPVHGEIVEIRHKGVKSALRLMQDLPRLYDLVYELLPLAYNKTSQRFGGIKSVRIWNGEEKYQEARANRSSKYLAKPARTKFYQREVDYDYGDGFVYPVLYGLTALMAYEDGEVRWRTEPDAFLRANLERAMQSYWTIIQGQSYDPAKVGKASGSYSLMTTLFESALNEELLQRLLKERAA